MRRTLAIGDIHGCSRSFEKLLDTVGVTSDDTLVALGDYVDRGPDSRGVIDRLISLDAETNLVPIRGNHEIMMLEALKSSGAMLDWLGVGGDDTLESYGSQSISGVPKGHWEFIRATKPYYESENLFFVHAKAYGDLWLADQPDYMLFWEFFDDPLPEPHCSGKVMVCGHTPQRDGLPKSIGHAICIDTFAHGGGWLTCLDVDANQYWQANESGECRMDVLADF